MSTFVRGVLLPISSCGALLCAALPAAAQTQHWVRQFGTALDDTAAAAASDGSGGVFLGGSTDGDLGGTSAGGQDVWISRYDLAGNQLWIRQFGTSAADDARVATEDGSGGVYVGGITSGSLGGASFGGEDGWLGRFDSAGNTIWTRQIGTAWDDTVGAAAPDGSGGVYVTGWTTGPLGGSIIGGGDIWVARYDGAGNRLWARQFGTTLTEYPNCAAADGSGGVYLCGYTFGNLGGTSAGSTDAWYAHFDGAGTLLWIHLIGTNDIDVADIVASDGAGGLFLGGATLGSLGGPQLGGGDAWLARCDSAGTLLWIQQFGTAQDDEIAIGVGAADGSGGVYVGGVTRGSFGGAYSGAADSWLARYDGAGSQLWIAQLGTAADDFTWGLAPDGSGGAYVCGPTTGSLGGPSAGGEDAWLARYGPAAALLCEPGSGGVIACPCTNPPSGPARGCDNSFATGGATLDAAGDSKLSADTLAFTAQGEAPTALSILLQGSSPIPTGIVFGQGVRCAGGTLKRLYAHAASAGAVTMPDLGAGDASISARSAALGDTILAGQSRFYAMYYRDPAVLGGCSAASTFNAGPTLRADWQP